MSASTAAATARKARAVVTYRFISFAGSTIENRAVTRAGRLVVALLIASAGYAYAQFRRDFGGFGGLRGEQGDPAELPPAERPDRHLAGCHILYTSVRRESNGSGWRTDYPWGQRNLLIRLSEMTKTRVSRPAEGPPHVYLVRLTDPALFECSYLMASDVGTIGLSDEEATALGVYLQKGGFLWVDDFWGEAAWEHWTRELAKAMPPRRVHHRRRAARPIRSFTRRSK